MSDLDFSSTSPMKPAPQPAAPPPPPVYNAAMAMEFFKSAGKPESFAPGATIFKEDDKGGGLLGKRDKMYVLIMGEVEMIAQDKVIGTVRAGETFGEMAVIAQAPRTVLRGAIDRLAALGYSVRMGVEIGRASCRERV